MLTRDMQEQVFLHISLLMRGMVDVQTIVHRGNETTEGAFKVLYSKVRTEVDGFYDQWKIKCVFIPII